MLLISGENPNVMHSKAGNTGLRQMVLCTELYLSCPPLIAKSIIILEQFIFKSRGVNIMPQQVSEFQCVLIHCRFSDGYFCLTAW